MDTKVWRFLAFPTILVLLVAWMLASTPSTARTGDEAAGQEIADPVLSAVCYDTYFSGEPEEAFRLMNGGEPVIDLIGPGDEKHFVYLPFVTRTTPWTIRDIATSPGLPGVLVLKLESDRTWLRPLYSLDGGSTWHQVRTVPWEGLPWNVYPRGVGIAIAPRGDQTVRLLVAPFGYRLYRTGDFGLQWASVDVGPYFYDFEASPAQPDRLYLTFSQAYGFPPVELSFAARSDDAGLTWAGVNSAWWPERFGIVVPSPVLAGKVYLHSSGEGWLESSDAGITWLLRDFPADLRALDATDPQLLYGRGMRSSDGGQTWHSMAPMPAGCYQLLAHPAKSRVLLLRCDQGIYRSIDAGDTWNLVSAIQGNLLAPDYGVPGRILLARSDELWVSTSDGSEWIELDLALDD